MAAKNQKLWFGNVALRDVQRTLERYNIGSNSTLMVNIFSFGPIRIFVKTLTGKIIPLVVNSGLGFERNCVIIIVFN